MRRSELLSLRWQNVHLIDRYVRLSDTKNGGREMCLLLDVQSRYSKACLAIKMVQSFQPQQMQ